MCLFELILQPFIRKKNKTHIVSNPSNKEVVDALRATIPAFRPIVHGPVLQTLAGLCFSSQRPKGLKWSYNTINTDIVVRFWKYIPPAYKPDERPTIVCVPGLSGEVSAHYINQIGKKCMQEQWPCYVLDKIELDIGSTRELEILVDKIGTTQKRIVLIGVSLGGNIVCHYCSKPVINPAVKLCIPVGNGFNFRVVSSSMHYIWSSILLVGYKKWLLSKTKFDAKIPSKTLWDFKNMDEYLANTSSHEIIEHVKIPLFIINSMDDPFFSYNALDNIYNVIQNNKNVFLLSTSIGGHIGWCKGVDNVSWVFDDVLPVLVKMF
jgi:predicted alpha/beta-fold hydrolase